MYEVSIEKAALKRLEKFPHADQARILTDMIKQIHSPRAEEIAMTIAQQYIEEGRKEGIEEGIQTRDKEIVLRMNASGMSVEEIVSSTGISKADVLGHLSSDG